MRQRPGFLSSWRKPPPATPSANRPILIRRRVTENRSSCLDYDFDSGTEIASQSSAGGSARQARHRSTRICQGDHDDREDGHDLKETDRLRPMAILVARQAGPVRGAARFAPTSFHAKDYGFKTRGAGPPYIRDQ